MKGDPQIIDYLQKAVRAELTAINQYALHAEVLDNLGLTKLAAHWRAEVQDESGHRDRYIARMVFLGAVPDVAILNPVRVGKTLPDILKADLAAEMDGRALYVEAATAALAAGDIGTHALFMSILGDEEGHIDHLERQLAAINTVGVQAYAAQYLDPMGDG